MKNTTGKYSGDDKGIAIMFSLIMLSVFFLISFGFVSMATSHKSSAAAREPEQQATLAADDMVLNEALFAIEKALMAGETPNYSKFRSMVFTNSSATVDVTLQTWATQKLTSDGTPDQTSLEDALPLQLNDSDDFKPNTDTSIINPEWANVGWITHDIDGDSTDDEYCWMVIESSGVDPNYIGGNGGGLISGVSSEREGTYIREIDVGDIDADFRVGGANDVYVDWTVDPPDVWEDKKSLVTAMTSQIETAISLFEPGTSPITLKSREAGTDLIDLSRDCTSYTAQQLHDDISWLKSLDTDDSKRLACNIMDYIDEDNVASLIDTDIYGKERVPYINEVLFKVTNNTTGGTTSDPEPIRVEVEATPELVKMVTVGAWGNGSTDSHIGTGSSIIIKYNIRAEKISADAAIINETDNEIIITEDLSGSLIKGYHQYSTGSDPVFVSTGTSTTSSTHVTVTITLTDITLTGNGSAVWDFAKVGQSATATAIQTGASNAQYVSFEAADCRNNHTSWLANAFSTSDSGTGSMFGIAAAATNTNYAGMDGEFSEPYNTSTAYMPEDGKIQYLSEVGMISRGQVGQTINLTDYNLNSPTTFVPGKYQHDDPAKLELETSSTFNGGDRALLDFVYVGNPGAKGTQNLVSYQQFGVINPNTTNKNVLKLLLTNVRPLVGPASSSPAPAVATITDLVDNFPGIEKSSNSDKYFKVDQFHDTTGDTYHNRNPKRYEYAFSLNHTTPISLALLNDAQREALVIQTMNLVSPKYSYFTILSAVRISAGSPTSISSFVRRDNESGSYKILRKSTTP